MLCSTALRFMQLKVLDTSCNKQYDILEYVTHGMYCSFATSLMPRAELGGACSFKYIQLDHGKDGFADETPMDRTTGNMSREIKRPSVSGASPSGSA